MDSAVKAVSEYGLGGAVIAALFWLVYFILREHKIERIQWLDAYKQNTDVLRGLGSKCGTKPP